jgi:hypothetical protein
MLSNLFFTPRLLQTTQHILEMILVFGCFGQYHFSPTLYLGSLGYSGGSMSL